MAVFFLLCHPHPGELILPGARSLLGNSQRALPSLVGLNWLISVKFYTEPQVALIHIVLLHMTLEKIISLLNNESIFR